MLLAISLQLPEVAGVCSTLGAQKVFAGLARLLSVSFLWTFRFRNERFTDLLYRLIKFDFNQIKFELTTCFGASLFSAGRLDLTSGSDS